MTRQKEPVMIFVAVSHTDEGSGDPKRSKETRRCNRWLP